MYVDLQTIGHLWPEIVLILLATWIYVGGTIQQSRWWWALFALAGYGIAGYSVASAPTPPPFQGPLALDLLGNVVRVPALALGMLFTLMFLSTARRTLASEAIATLMLLICGLMLVGRANDIVLLFVSLELVSIPTYVLLYLGRRDRATSEAAVKYFFLSILSSAMLLYGLTMLYGMAGTTTLAGPDSIQAKLLSGAAVEHGVDGLGPLALVLIVAGLGFKIAAAPFHFYAPDVYQGATNTNAGLLAVAPKIAGVIALVRVAVIAMPMTASFAWQLALVLALLTMTIGNACALWQQNMRRLMAYSSIAHAGYMLIGVAVAMATSAPGGISATLFYLLVYAFASLGTFAALASLGNDEHEVSRLEQLAGLGKSQPVVAGAIAVCMFSLAGIPPLAGFWGKFTLFTSAIRVATDTPTEGISVWFVILAVGGALNAAIAAAYYLRVVAVMYFQPTREEVARGSGGARTAMVIASMVVLSLGVFPRTLFDATQRAERSVVRQSLASEPPSPTETVARK